MTQLDVALWLGILIVSLAMISFRWGAIRGVAASALATLLLPLGLASIDNLTPELALAAALLLAAVIPLPGFRSGQKSGEPESHETA